MPTNCLKLHVIVTKTNITGGTPKSYVGREFFCELVCETEWSVNTEILAVLILVGILTMVQDPQNLILVTNYFW